MTDSDCPVAPEHIRQKYGINMPRQYPNINVPSCVSTTRIQPTRYLLTPLSWPRQPFFDEEHSKVNYNHHEQVPLYRPIATKNLGIAPCCCTACLESSNSPPTSVGMKTFVEIDKPEKYSVYTPYPHARFIRGLSDPCVYAVSERQRDKY